MHSKIAKHINNCKAILTEVISFYASLKQNQASEEELHELLEKPIVGDLGMLMSPKEGLQEYVDQISFLKESIKELKSQNEDLNAR